ncbi:hypothetical protein QYM36_006450 [Artemia franciscana]|uniref:Reverse transcriptase domain-containing protein n=1 Tax=Artemia franciscana TaxID=6661 RepID=A0AA88HWP2_ARTSF|nr:hypothetical protein QYM36_006450 [Artemia franciscana]
MSKEVVKAQHSTRLKGCTRLTQEWKTTYITPIFKKGRKELAVKYRSIRKTSTVVGALEKMANSAVIQNTETNNLLHRLQHGFRSGRSVDTNLLESYGYITKFLDTEVPPTEIFLLDFSKLTFKAFDQACHKGIAVKLHALKLKEEFSLWIFDFLPLQLHHVELLLELDFFLEECCWCFFNFGVDQTFSFHSLSPSH